MENILFLGFAISFLLLMSFHVYQTNAFFLRLKDKHKDTWKELGQPQWKIHFGDSGFKNAMKYIRQKKFENLNDDELLGCYKRIKRIEYAALAIAALILLLTVLDVLKG